MNRHSAHTLGILALIALVLWWLFGKSVVANSAAQDGYVPPNMRLDDPQLNGSSCPCSGATAQSSSNAKQAALYSRSVRSA